MSDDKQHDETDSRSSRGKNTKPEVRHAKKKRPSLAARSGFNETVALLAEGQLLAGRYRIVEQIGIGGMGIVYKVEDEKLENRLFALKALPPDMAKSSAAIKRLKKEALAAIELHHPNIMALHSFDNDGPHHFLVMELLDGPDLDDALVDKEKFSSAEVLKIARQVCPALDHAHKLGVVHRDIKPGNLLFTKQGDEQVVKIADFGIAYQIRDSIARITGQDTTGGTLHYMPPEQLAGRSTDARSDQYALAATLYELLSGRTPFQGAGGVLIHQIKSEQPEAIDGVPEQINSALLKAMSKTPEERYDSCGNFLEALEGKQSLVESPAPLHSTKKTNIKLLPAILCFLLIIFVLGAHHFGFFAKAPLATAKEVVPSPLAEPKQTKEPTQVAVLPPTNLISPPSKNPGPITPSMTTPPKERIVSVPISSTPSGAFVSITSDVNRVFQGKTPCLAKLTPGTYSLRFAKAGYDSKEQKLTVKWPTTSEITTTLTEQVGWLTLKVVPPEASVKIGQWPLPVHKRKRLARKPGTYTFSATKAGYEKAQKSVFLRSGEHKIVEFKLTPAPSKFDTLVARARGGDATAQLKLAEMYRDGKDVNMDNQKAVAWFRKAAAQGSAKGQTSLGFMYHMGKGVSKNYNEAMKWYRKAAKQGYVNAQSNLALMYKNGWGTNKNYQEAAKWFRRAAEGGQSNGQNDLGNMYLHGTGVAKNYSEALKWYRKAAAQKNRNAQCSLGYLYDKGLGVARDFGQAVYWYRRSAEQGYALAQYNLGLKYENGQGVRKDYRAAEKWYKKSAEQGYAPAKAKLSAGTQIELSR